MWVLRHSFHRWRPHLPHSSICGGGVRRLDVEPLRAAARCNCNWVGILPNLSTLLTSQGSCLLVHSTARLDFCANQTGHTHKRRTFCMYVYASPLTHTYVYVYVCICIYIYMHKFISIYYIHIYLYISINIYISVEASPCKGILAPPIAYKQLLQGGRSSLSLH